MEPEGRPVVGEGISQVWIGIDIGTSGCKVLALDEQGQPAAVAVRPYELFTPRAGWAEQDPADWWRAADEGVQEVLARLRPHGEGPVVVGFGLTGQMHGLTPLDVDGNVLRRAILWNDQRSARQCDEITQAAGGLVGLLALTGNAMLPGYTAGKILWLREHEPQVWAGLAHVLNPKDYLRLLMTGEYVTEVSDASGTGLFDVPNRRWSTELLDRIGLPHDLLPPAVESAEITGGLTSELAERWGLPRGVPVVGGGGDSVLQTTSQGVVGSGAIGVTLGTAGIVGAASVGCPPNPDGRLQVFCGNAPHLWHVMGVALSAGGAFAWLREALAPLLPGELTYEVLVDLASTAPPGSRGLLFLPYLLGERCPNLAPDARAAWVGLSPFHTAPHLVRSVMEGVLLNLREIFAVFDEAGLGVPAVLLSGGATTSPFWQQLLADVLQLDVSVVTGAEHGGAFGAAFLAGVATGQWDSVEQIATVVTLGARTTPDTALADLYRGLHSVHRTLLPALDNAFSSLTELKGVS